MSTFSNFLIRIVGAYDYDQFFFFLLIFNRDGVHLFGSKIGSILSCPNPSYANEFKSFKTFSKQKIINHNIFFSPLLEFEKRIFFLKQIIYLSTNYSSYPLGLPLFWTKISKRPKYIPTNFFVCSISFLLVSPQINLIKVCWEVSEILNWNMSFVN